MVKGMTNADKIRSLNDEELYTFLFNIKKRTKLFIKIGLEKSIDNFVDKEWLEEEYQDEGNIQMQA